MDVLQRILLKLTWSSGSGSPKFILPFAEKYFKHAYGLVAALNFIATSNNEDSTQFSYVVKCLATYWISYSWLVVSTRGLHYHDSLNHRYSRLLHRTPITQALLCRQDALYKGWHKLQTRKVEFWHLESQAPSLCKSMQCLITVRNLLIYKSSVERNSRRGQQKDLKRCA